MKTEFDWAKERSQDFEHSRYPRETAVTIPFEDDGIHQVEGRRCSNATGVGNWMSGVWGPVHE